MTFMLTIISKYKWSSTLKITVSDSLVPRPHPLKEGKVWCTKSKFLDRTEDKVPRGLYEFYYVVKSLRLQVQCS